MQIITLIFGLLLLFLLARVLGKLILYIPRLVACLFEMVIHFAVVEPLYKHNHPEDEEPHTPQGSYSPHNPITWSSDKTVPQNEETQQEADQVKEVPSPAKESAPDEPNPDQNSGNKKASAESEEGYVAPNRLTWSSDKAAQADIQPNTDTNTDNAKETSPGNASSDSQTTKQAGGTANEAGNTNEAENQADSDSQDNYEGVSFYTADTPAADTPAKDTTEDTKHTEASGNKTETSPSSPDTANTSSPHQGTPSPQAAPAASAPTSAPAQNNEITDDARNYHFKQSGTSKPVGTPSSEGKKENVAASSSRKQAQKKPLSSAYLPEENYRTGPLDKAKMIGGLAKTHTPKKTIGLFLNTPPAPPPSSTPRSNHEVSRPA